MNYIKRKIGIWTLNNIAITIIDKPSITYFGIFGCCVQKIRKRSESVVSQPFLSIKQMSICRSCALYYMKTWRNERTNECTHCEWNMYVCISLIAHVFSRSITHSYDSARERKVLVYFVEKEKQDTHYFRFSLFSLACLTMRRFRFLLTSLNLSITIRFSVFF